VWVINGQSPNYTAPHLRLYGGPVNHGGTIRGVAMAPLGPLPAPPPRGPLAPVPLARVPGHC